MAEKIENALNESRGLILVAQVLIGFQYQSVFQSGFGKLPLSSQYAILFCLGLMLVALVLLMSPAAYHRIVEQGNVSQSLYKFISAVSMPALLPFSFALGADWYVLGEKLLSRNVGYLFATLATAFALIFWYGIEVFAHRRGKPPKENGMDRQPTSIDDKIKFVMTEARVVLPGAQALLGFQFAAILTEAFDKLNPVTKEVHCFALASITVSIVFLMAPAAFHRITERGENTERLHSFSSRMVLCAMAFLALGISSDVFVVVQKVMHSTKGAFYSSSFTLLVFYTWWFGYMLYRKSEEHPPAERSVSSSS